MEMEVEELSRAERKFVEKSQTPWLKRCISLSYGIEIMGYSRSPLESTFEARQFEKKILFVGRFLRDSTHLPTHAKFGDGSKPIRPNQTYHIFGINIQHIQHRMAPASWPVPALQNPATGVCSRRRWRCWRPVGGKWEEKWGNLDFKAQFCLSKMMVAMVEFCCNH